MSDGTPVGWATLCGSSVLRSKTLPVSTSGADGRRAVRGWG